MNRNCFLLKNEEFWFLAGLQGADLVKGYQGCRPEQDADKIRHCKYSLERKRYLKAEENGTVVMDECLDACMYVVTHAQGHGRAVSEKGEELLIYIMGESIVSLTCIGGEIELSRIPIIHFAIGQISGLIRKGSALCWTVSAEYYADNTKNTCNIDAEDDYVESIKEIANIWIGLYGNIIQDGKKTNYRAVL